MKIVPVLLVKNEEVWIQRVLTSLANVFPNIIVCDTGSTDATRDKIIDTPNAMALIIPDGSPANHSFDEFIQTPNITVYQKGNVSPQGLTACRQFMQDEAQRRFQATHIFLVDADELYPTAYLRYIADHPMPDYAPSGFTSGVEVGELENGELWIYGNQGAIVGLNRQAIIPVTSRWKGEYPFESPDCYTPGSPLNHYFLIPEGLKGFYHLHHTRRSAADADVYLRVQKRDQFSMRDAPELQPFIFWLKNQEAYIDE